MRPAFAARANVNALNDDAPRPLLPFMGARAFGVVRMRAWAMSLIEGLALLAVEQGPRPTLAQSRTWEIQAKKGSHETAEDPWC